MNLVDGSISWFYLQLSRILLIIFHNFKRICLNEIALIYKWTLGIKMPHALSFILITKRNLLMCLFGQATPDDSSLAVCASPAWPVSASPMPYSLDCPVLLITGLSQQLPACLPLALGAGVPGNWWAFLSPEKTVAESCLQSAVHSRVSLGEFAPDL